MTFVLDPAPPKKMSFFPLHSKFYLFPDPSPPFWTLSLNPQFFFEVVPKLETSINNSLH